ncbi:RHS repeat-associated core domain-containing protein [Chryseobacterium sp. Y16C]|uniref:DUF6443 domain-containing protein n=1 Tax=Chryseobacterium sp. Y16C TaxID=2920939 RepID=UPI001F0B1367|nr:DUF6443 domain-containing protein [Chryseobacterium sp. Y16C]UMQ42859.1 RHS repeat-associated core domain-containing protein [Chryseobacterium sp. Y16C]
MKKILSILGILFLITVSAQNNLTPTENYIYSKSCLNGDCTKAAESVQYFDSFGKPFQTINIKSTPSGKDVVQHIPYDSFGRSVDSWMPVPVNTSGGAVQDTSAVKNTALSVYGDSRPFSHTVLEKSPLGRPVSSISVGQDWQNHPVTMGYNANKANEVKKYTVSTSWIEGRTKDALSQSGYYPANTLVKTSVTDEDGNTSIEYKNKAGRVLLVKKGAGTAEETDTYYVYNEYNQLAMVIPPLAVNAPMNQTTYDNLCYQYHYDGWNRLVEKKLPGKGWEYMIYDQQDRLIMSQDANLRAADNTFGAKGWLVTKYDKWGRIAYTGFVASTDSRATLQNNVSNLTVNAENNEARSTTSFIANGLEVYYTQNAFPAGNMTVLTVNYYDTYPSYSFNPAAPASVFGQEIMTDTQNAPVSTRGLPTLSLVKNIEDNSWTKNYVYYDTKGRSVATYSINHLGGYTKTEMELDFAGMMQQTKTYHKRLAADTEKIITQSFEYDAQNRLKKQWHTVNGLSAELLAENTYNELSQLINKKAGASVIPATGGISSPLQSIDYTYNVRGAVTKVNDPANLGLKLFGYGLKSFNPQNTGSATGKYNGNITEVDWKTATDNILRRYNYQYDHLNRLKKGIFSEPGTSVPQNDFYNEMASYDLNGNITSLQRNTKGASGIKEQIDDLVYTYDGNKLQTVVDGSGNYAGYPDTSGTVISYDDNGNMTSQADKGIVSILYNYLDLPGEIKFNSTYTVRNVNTGEDEVRYVRTNYIYRADGTKLRKKYTGYFSKFKSERTTTTDYLDGFQYTIDYLGAVSLDFVPTSEGYYDFKNNRYIYNYADHLGNIRLSYFRNGTNGSAEVLEENNYYPFGLKHQGYNGLQGNPAYKYQYNGKELQEETGWNDYGARMYMPDIGRWGVIDPLTEQMRRYSPYNYAFNNPISYIDPDGRKSMIYSDGGVMRWDFDPNSTLTGIAWFEESFKYLSFGGSQILAQGLSGGGGYAQDGESSVPGATTYSGQEAYDVLQQMLNPTYDFSKFDFSQFGADPIDNNKFTEKSNPFEFSINSMDIVYEQKYIGTKSTKWVDYKPDSFILGHSTNIATGIVLGSFIKSPISSGIAGESVGLFNQTEVQYKATYALYQQKSYSAKITFNLLGEITNISNLQIKTQISGYLMNLDQRIYYPLGKSYIDGGSFNRHKIQQNFKNSLPKVGGYIFDY